MKKRTVGILVLLFGIVLGFAMFCRMQVSSSATSLTSESIRQKEEQIKKAEEERKNLQNSLTDAKKIKKQLEAEKNDLKKYVTELDQKLEEIQANIADLNMQIADKETEITVTQEELAAAKEKEAQQYESMVIQIQMTYEQGDSSFLNLLFSGGTFSDILNKLEYVEQVSAYSQNLLDEYMLNRQLIELCEQELIAAKEVLDEMRDGVLAEEAALEELIAAKEQAIKEYDSSISNKEAAIREYEADVKEQNEIIETLEKAIAEEKRKLLAESGSVIIYDGGQFKFPLASYTRISSEYGNRIHPTLGVQKFHNGVDFAAPTGTAIYAAYDGKVVAAAYSSSMGNYVMIDHGSGLYTIYMHASKLYVSTGAVVVRGETIAAVGSTGRSTGPHLHFSVRLDGAYTSPWNYLSQ